MSGVGLKLRPPADGDVVCLLQCAHPPGKPLQLWLCELPLSQMQEAQDDDALPEMWQLLQYLYPTGGEK